MRVRGFNLSGMVAPKAVRGERNMLLTGPWLRDEDVKMQGGVDDET
jgi:hypothetical protein